MSDVQQQGQGIPPEKLIAKLRNRIADLEVQNAMLESYIEILQEEKGAAPVEVA